MAGRITHVRYLVLAWFCLMAMLAYVHRSCLSVPANRIGGELGINKDEMSWILSLFLWGYAVLQIPSGWFGDRFGSRLVVPIIVTAWSLATGLMALAGVAIGVGFLVLALCRFLMGMAQAGIFPCTVLSFSRWFPQSERGLPNGLLAAFMSVGAVIGSALTGFLLQFESVTWQAIMVAFALPGVAAALGFYVWFRDWPQEHPWVTPEELEHIRGGAFETIAPTKANDAMLGQPALLSGRWLLNMVWICGQQFCRAAGYIFYLTWFPTFLQEARGMTETESGYYTSIPLLGVVLGSAVGGAVSDWIWRRTGSLTWSRQGLAVVSLLFAGLFLAAGFLTEDALLTVLLLGFSSIFAGLCGPSGYAVTIDLGGKHVATVFSVMNMAGNIGAALLPLAARRVEKIHSWDHALLFLAGLYGVATLCWLAMRLPGRVENKA